jgi:hypothetical protein
MSLLRGHPLPIRLCLDAFFASIRIVDHFRLANSTVCLNLSPTHLCTEKLGLVALPWPCHRWQGGVHCMEHSFDTCKVILSRSIIVACDVSNTRRQQCALLKYPGISVARKRSFHREATSRRSIDRPECTFTKYH